jgi:hypothetical protein
METKTPLIEKGGTVVANSIPVRASEFIFKKQLHGHGTITETTPFRVKNIVFRVRDGTLVTLVGLVEKPGALFDSSNFTYTPLSTELSVLRRFTTFMRDTRRINI